MRGTQSARALAGALAAVLAVAPVAAAPAGPPDSARFRIVCHFECGPIAEAAALAAEAAWPLAEEWFGPAPAEPGRPLELHLYRTPAAYAAARSGLLRPAPTRLAVTEPHSRSAHVAIPEGVADTTLAAYGLPGTVLRVVAHEAFHLAALAHAPGSARLPAWLAEGAASWAEHEALRAIGRAGPPEAEPVASTYQWLVQRRLRMGELPHATLILDDSLPGFDDGERYALRKLFFEFLRESSFAEPLAAGARAAAAHAGRRSLLRRSPAAASVRAVLNAALLGDDAEAAADSINAGFRAHVLSLSPGWIQSARSLDRVGRDDWLQIGMSGDAAAWRVRYAPAVEVRGTVRFLTGGAARVLIDSNGGVHLTLTFDRDAGVLRVERTGGGVDGLIGEAPLPGLAAGEATFHVAARRGTLRIAIDGEPPRMFEVAQLEPNGAWGLGASSGTSVLWVGLTDRP